MNCKICNHETFEFTTDTILNKYVIKYFQCSTCEFIQTEEPYWLEEAYSESINLTDTGVIKRNYMLANFSSIIIFIFFNKNKSFLDFAGGYGIFTRIMRDIGFDFYWKDKYSTNLVARGFEYDKCSHYQVVTSFESFEHFVNPLYEIEGMLSMSDNILLSTTLIPKKNISPKSWDYYALEHGQHISFYSIRTMKYIANKYNLNFYTNGKNIHLFTKSKIGINNIIFKTLYILSRLGLSNIIQLFCKSKTIKDAKYLMEKHI